MKTDTYKAEIGQRLYSAEQAGIYLGRSAWSVREMVRSGRLHFVKDGRRIFLDKRDLDNWIEKNRQRNYD